SVSYTVSLHDALTISTTGSVRDGYVLGQVKADPEKVRVDGPKSVIDRIDKVVAEVDVTGLSEDAVLNSKLAFYDREGKIIDTTRSEEHTSELQSRFDL